MFLNQTLLFLFQKKTVNFCVKFLFLFLKLKIKLVVLGEL